jgi:hypothetical protein
MRFRSVISCLFSLWMASPVLAQGAEHPDSGWTVRASAAADLWFHGMAVARLYDAERPLPLYNVEYVERVQAVKRERGISTALDSLGPAIRRQFFRSDAPDFFHFVPMYFSRTRPQRMLTALGAVANQRIRDTILNQPDVRLGAAAVAAQMTALDARRLVDRFVEALQDEWDRFYEGYWQERRRVEADRYAEIRDMWATRLGPSLTPFLSRAHLEGGVILLSPPLGLEGRMDEGDSFDGHDNMVAVWLPPGAHGADRSTFVVLKELCFALVNRVPMSVTGSSREQEAVRARAAVRCGHLLLEFYEPTLLARYRRVFLESLGEVEPQRPVEAFERLYPLPTEVYDALRDEIRRRE